MKKKAREELLADLLSHLHDQNAQERGGLPDAGAPQKNLVRYQRDGKGFWPSLFDPYARLKKRHEYARFSTELNTQTTLQKLLAEAAIEKAQINKQVAVDDHRHKAQEWLQTMALKNSAQALHRRYEDFLEEMDRSLDLDMDPYLQQQFVRNLYELYFGCAPDGIPTDQPEQPQAEKKGTSDEKD